MRLCSIRVEKKFSSKRLAKTPPKILMRLDTVWMQSMTAMLLNYYFAGKSTKIVLNYLYFFICREQMRSYCIGDIVDEEKVENGAGGSAAKPTKSK